MLTQEQQKVYDEMFATLGTKGWAHIEKYLQEDFIALNQVLAISDDKTLYRVQGRLYCLQTLIDFRNNLKAEFDELSKEENSGEAFDTSILEE